VEASAAPKPKISVLLASWNCAGALRRALTAIGKSAELERIETIVVDMGSRDASARMDAEFPFVTVLRMPRNFGRTRARNMAARTAKGEFLLLLDPAVEVAPPTIAALADQLAATPDAAAISAVPVNLALPTIEELAAECRGDRPPTVIDTAFMVRRNFLAGMSFFDEKRYTNCYYDLDLLRHLHASGKQVLLADGAGVTVGQAPERDWSSGERALLASDRIACAAAYAGKTGGFMAALGFRIKFVFSTFAGMLAFRDPGFRVSLLSALLTGSRIDGTQGGVLG
jgi:glycosyltransferase involved in cell wall biosynthesis